MRYYLLYSTVFCTISMRIIYVTDAFTICGGIERVLTDKMNYLSAYYGYSVSLITIYQGTHSFPFLLDKGIKHVDVKVRLNQQYEYKGLFRVIKRWSLKNTIKSKMSSILSELKPDVIVCVKLDFASLLNDIKGTTPLVVESHTLCQAERFEHPGFFRRLHLWMLKSSIRKVDAVVALTDGDAKDWRKINPSVYVIPNVVHLNEKDNYSDCQSKSIIFVGRLSKQKNIGALLNIWKRTFVLNPEWSLHVYGEKGDLGAKVYNRLLEARKINVVLHEPVKDNIIDEYKKHSILVLTSVFEPFGLVIPEAMSCGLPVISFDSPYGPTSIISDEKDGFLIHNYNEDVFVERLCQLMTDEQLRQEMSKNAVVSSRRYESGIIMPLWKKLFEDIRIKNPKHC